MKSSLLVMVVALAVPTLAVILGGVIATLRSPGPQVQSAIQHFAAGVVFAAAAAEVLPDLLHTRGESAAFEVVLGFASGTALMLGLRRFSDWLERRRKQRQKGKPEAEQTGPTSLIAAIAIDVLIDGVLVGVGFAVGMQQGILLTFAITLELVLLGLSIASAMSDTGASRSQAIALTCIPAGMFAAGAVLGVTVLSGLTGAALEIVLAFGIAALLYLVTEELLTEAHEGPETSWGAAMFFAGFLVLLVVDLLSAV